MQRNRHGVHGKIALPQVVKNRPGRQYGRLSGRIEDLNPTAGDFPLDSAFEHDLRHAELRIEAQVLHLQIEAIRFAGLCKGAVSPRTKTSAPRSKITTAASLDEKLAMAGVSRR